MNWNVQNGPAPRCSFSPGWTRIKRSHSSSPKTWWWCSDLAHSFGLAQCLSLVREGLWAALLGSLQQDELRSALWRGKCWAKVGESTDDLCWDFGCVKSLMSKAEFLPPFFVAGRVPLNELFEKMVWARWTCPGSKTQLCGARIFSNYFWYRAWTFMLLQRLHLWSVLRSLALVSQIQTQDEMADGCRQAGLIWCLLSILCLPV